MPNKTTYDENIKFLIAKTGPDLGVLKYLDDRLAEITKHVESNEHPSEDALDTGEYLAGLGFCILQQTIVASTVNLGITKSKYLDFGPVTESNDSIVSVINAAANYWKHESEWPFFGILTNHNHIKTAEKLSKNNDSADFPMVGVLYELCEQGPLSFVRCLEFIQAWEVELSKIPTNGK